MPRSSSRSSVGSTIPRTSHARSKPTGKVAITVRLDPARVQQLQAAAEGETSEVAGKRFAVDMRVKVGHLDPASGTIF